MRLWRKRGQLNHAFGRSRGGFSTKIYVACDALGNPIRFILTGGHVSDYVPAIDLIAIATRYDKTDQSFMGFILIASITLCLT
jgi:hypothetical protein